MSVKPRAEVREVSEEEKEITSKDLTRKQLVLYVFNDFLRGLYVAGCLFLDGLVILYITYFIPPEYLTRGALSNVYMRDIILGLFTLSIEVLVVFYQFRAYRRIWPKGSLFIGHRKERKISENELS